MRPKCSRTLTVCTLLKPQVHLFSLSVLFVQLAVRYVQKCPGSSPIDICIALFFFFLSDCELKVQQLRN